MTDLQRKRSIALAQCGMCPGSWEKRFARDMASLAKASPDRQLTPKQAQWIAKLSWRFRAQMPPLLVPAQDPFELDEPKSTEELETHTETNP